MKKIIMSMVLLFALFICTTACSGGEDRKPTLGEDSTAEQTVYEQLDALADVNYKKVKVGVVTDTDNVQLFAEYILTQYNVHYSIEQLNKLPPNGDITGISPEYKSTITGTASVDNGEMIILDGIEVTLPTYDALKGDFNFDENNLKNVIIEDNVLKAEVVSSSTFYGSEVNVENMKITVEYTQTAFSKIIITYQTAYSSVKTTYEFEI